MSANPPAPARHRSFAPVVDARTRVLILGSLPGVASLTAGRYYAHPRNQFWRLVGDVIDRDLVSLDYDARLAALLYAGIGLWDMVAEAAREGSLDSAIRDIETNDLTGLCARLPALRILGFNGAKAASLALRHFRPNDRQFQTMSLPSSSPAFTSPFAEKRRIWQALRPWLDGAA